MSHVMRDTYLLCVDVCQVQLSNPSSKPLIYQAILSGRDASAFSLPKGRVVTVGAKSSVNVTVEFRSRFMRSCEAVLVMAGRRLGATSGCSLVFSLRTCVDSITPQVACSTERYLPPGTGGGHPGYNQQLGTVLGTKRGFFHLVPWLSPWVRFTSTSWLLYHFAVC